MASKPRLLTDLALRWDAEASSAERLVRNGIDGTPATSLEKRVLAAHGLVFRRCAQELRNEVSKEVRRG